MISFGLPLLLHEKFGVAEASAVGIGFASAYLANIWLLRTYVFRSQGSWKEEMLRYVITNAAFRLVEYAAFYILFDIYNIDYRLALLSVLGVSAVIKFFMYRWVFSSR